MLKEAYEFFGKIDVLVNNAAGGIQQSIFLEASEELWEKTYKLNITSVLLLTSCLVS